MELAYFNKFLEFAEKRPWQVFKKVKAAEINAEK